MKHSTSLISCVWLILAGFASAGDEPPTPQGRVQSQPFQFRDAGDEAGLFPNLAGVRAHGAAWGDVDGSGWPSLFVNTFHDNGSKPAQLFRNDHGKFRLDGQEHLRTSGAGSGALFVDLTNNGRLDLYVSNCAIERNELRRIPNSLFRNDGDGHFSDVSKESGAIPPLYSGRGLSAIDADGDGLLDLLLCERYYGPVSTGPILLKNLGQYKFQNVSQQAGLPKELSGLGVAAADLNGDGWTDFFLTEGSGNHRLYLNDGAGKFEEAVDCRDVFRWSNLGRSDTPAGVSIADVNGDGLPDIVIGHHIGTAWSNPTPVRLYLHRGIKSGQPRFEQITEAAGLFPLPILAPHVEIQDFDNDGLPDIYVSVVKYKDGQTYPLIFKNLGVKNGLPHFRADSWSVNDSPNATELGLKKTTRILAELIKNKTLMYMAPGPSCDFDRDGRLDLLLPNWFIVDRSLLLRNETAGGNWLDIRVEGNRGVNRMGIGSKVRIFTAGKLGEQTALLGYREVAAGYGYCSGQEAVAHFGLSSAKVVDIEVALPHGKGSFSAKGIKVNQRIVLKQP